MMSVLPGEMPAKAGDPARLRALARYDILDTLSEAGFDDIVALAAQFCAAPVALVSLVDADRQWFKARIGFEACETSLDRSVCAHALETPGTLVVSDLTADARTRDNPMVVGPPHLRFYAGARLDTPDGHTLGMLCVMDHVPRPGGLDATQISALEALARQVVGQLELRRAVAERDVARRRLHSVFQTSYQLQGFVDLGGVLLDANDVSLRAIGRSLDHVVGQPFCETPWFSGTPGMEDAVRRAVAAAAAGEVIRREIEVQLPNGRRTLDVSIRPVRDACGTVFGLVPEAVDMTERKAFEDQLRQAQKMEAIGQLTGGVAHDFNNLLTVIRSSTDLLKRPNLPEERRARYVDAISDAVERAAKLTGQLLAFARRQALKPEVFAVPDSVRALSDMVRTLTGSRVRIALELAEQPCFVDADPSQFDTALVNMAINARDAMDGEGRLTLTVLPVDTVPAIRRHAAIHAPHVAVSLADTGSGIPADMVDRIFEPFFTTKATGKGTGLGLSQVFGFAKQSGGEITVASTVGEGTTFTLYLPRVAAPEQAAAPQELELPADGHGLRILVVEDNTDVGAFAVQSLTDLGYTTVLASDGAKALAELAEGVGRFDVVFSDVVMPGMSGIELGQEIRRLHRDLPIVLTSGYSHVLAENGTYGFELLHKPYSIEQLSKILRKAASWQRRTRSPA